MFAYDDEEEGLFSYLSRSLMGTMNGNDGDSNDGDSNDIDRFHDYGRDLRADSVYSSDFESESEEDEMGGEERLGNMMCKYVLLKKFDWFCIQYYSAVAISKFLKKVVDASKRKKRKELLEKLLEQEREKTRAIRERDEYLRRKKVHETLVSEFEKAAKARREREAEEAEKKRLKAEEDKVKKVKHVEFLKTLLAQEHSKLRAVRERKAKLLKEKEEKEEKERLMKEKEATERLERVSLKVNLDKRKAELKMMLDEDEAQWEEDMRVRREKRKSLVKGWNKEQMKKEQEKVNIMKEQQRLFFEKRRKGMMERQIEDRLNKIAERDNKDFYAETRLKLKAMSEGWRERHRLNRAWENVRGELLLEHHKKQFRPVLDNLVRFNSFKENGDKWIVIADELRSKVGRIEGDDNGEFKNDGNCTIM